MSEDIVDRARAALEGVTSGPWVIGPVDDCRIEDADGNEVAQIDGDYNQPDTWPLMEANARFIAAARQLVPEMIAEIERLRADAFTAADLAKAWEMGRDASIDACADYPRSSPEYSEYIHYDDQITHSQDCIRAMTPPADLAEKVKP